MALIAAAMIVEDARHGCLRERELAKLWEKFGFSGIGVLCRVTCTANSLQAILALPLIGGFGFLHRPKRLMQGRILLPFN